MGEFLHSFGLEEVKNVDVQAFKCLISIGARKHEHKPSEWSEEVIPFYIF